MHTNEPFEIWYARQSERSEREDLVTFINSCFAATGQSEYYSRDASQKGSLAFLHQYILANYRTVYARALAIGINHHNQALIIFNLLRSGAPRDAESRLEEGSLIRESLNRMPPNRVYSLFKRLASERVNNRRSRATVKEYFFSRPDIAFHATKYRNKLQGIARHSHLRLDRETSNFLFNLKSQKSFTTKIFQSYLGAHYSKQAVYELPFTVAEGLASKHGIPRDEFLRNIESRLTKNEKLRLLNASKTKDGNTYKIDFRTTPLTKLVLYVLSLPMSERITRAEEFDAVLNAAATAALNRFPFGRSKIGCVLDRSRSTAGSREKRNRTLAVAIATEYLMRRSGREYRSFWTPSAVLENNDSCEFGNPTGSGVALFPFLQIPSGQTDLATPLLQAIRWQPEQILIVSDGYENAPEGAVQQIVNTYRTRLAGSSPVCRPIQFIHANPVFDAEHIMPKKLGESIVTIGLRDAEDLAPSIGFAEFAAGDATKEELDNYLADVAREFTIGLESMSSE